MNFKTKRFFVHLGRDVLWFAVGGLLGGLAALITTTLFPVINSASAYGAAIPVGGLIGLHLYLVGQMIQRATDRIRFG